MKKIRTLDEYVNEHTIKNAEREKQKYAKHVDKVNQKKDSRTDEKKPKVKRRMDIQSYIIFLLGLREYSQAEIRTKLKLREHTDEEIDKALKWASEGGYQSDERYARSQIKAKSSRKGNRTLLYEMKRKGIDEEIIKDAIAELDSEEKRAARALDKYRNKEIDQKLKEKAFRSLAGKGFSYGSIKKAWEHVLNNTCDDDFE